MFSSFLWLFFFFPLCFDTGVRDKNKKPTIKGINHIHHSKKTSLPHNSFLISPTIKGAMEYNGYQITQFTDFCSEWCHKGRVWRYLYHKSRCLSADDLRHNSPSQMRLLLLLSDELPSHFPSFKYHTRTSPIHQTQ